MSTIFTQIINGEIPGNFVWADEVAVAFGTIEPRSPGHMLVVPREEVDNFLDASPEIIEHCSRVAQIIGQAGRRAFGVPRALIVVAGFDVPHLHIHVIPTASMEVLSPESKLPSDPHTLRDNAQKIREALHELGYGDNVPTAVCSPKLD